MTWADERQCVEPAPGGFLRCPQLGTTGEGMGIKDDGSGVSSINVRLSTRRGHNDRRARRQLAVDPMCS